MKRVLIVLMIVSLLSIGVAIASDVEDKRQELNEINERIERTKDELEGIKANQRNTANEIKDINEQQSETSDQIDHLNEQLLTTKNELEKIDMQLNQKTEELEMIEGQLEDTQYELENANNELERIIAKASEHEVMMAKRVRVMYMNRTSSYLELLLEADSINEMLDRLEIIRNVVSFDQKVLEEIELNRKAVDEQKAMLEDKEQEIKVLVDNVSEQKIEIEQTKTERNNLLAKLENQQLEQENLLAKLEVKESRRYTILETLESEEEKYERQLDGLERTSKQLESKIQELIRQLNERNRRAEFAGGVMQWPVPGFYRVTSPFGYRVHPVFGTRRMHSGIDIGSNLTDRGRQSIYGRNFVAAADGIVIFAGWFGGYGNCVIIDHGGDVTTLYAHGSRILVSEGQNVERGDPVLIVGSTGVSTGAHAHFEVRINGRPVDPMPYLRSR